MKQRWLRNLSRLGRDERGAVLVYVSLMLPVLVGFGVLAVDAARLSNLATSLQKGADALALAGAAELDRKPTAFTRADAAMADMVANQHRFAIASPATVTLASRRFLKSLPPNDVSAIDSSHETNDPEEARFVEVTIATQTLNTILPASFIGGASSVSTTARAVAGLDAVVCQFTPMFMCNPYEETATCKPPSDCPSIWDAASSPDCRRRQLKLQMGPSETYFPGVYGWLDSPDFGPGENGAKALRNALAAVRPPTCFIQNGVSQKPGNIASADAAINTRFDLWSGPFNGQHSNAAYRPDKNVRKGYVPGNGANGKCSAVPTDPNVNKLGRDSDFPYACGHLGKGDWNFDSYWSTNFGGIEPKPTGPDGGPPSRYDVYLHENDENNNLYLKPALAGAAAGETGAPACYSGPGAPDRRIIYAAIIDCADLLVTGNSGGPLRVKAFGKFFLTEPVAADGTIYAELIGFVEPGTVSNDMAHDIVQLYR